ncbi:hypothetical protein [Agromyces bauzanensis]|uniref:Uncharacterized protein n=1 Tax=Agromyces bauzanensis TaxID=1308924 RepID=A0A917PCC8_9MICO|nr:hypothetical protein [Agromyces bauzanensis]GGJ70694.1 hypothetical protein GCM10011372_05730 [Agromyces bauzanensis]
MSDARIDDLRVRSRSFRRPARSARVAGDVRESHGGRRLATGITIAAAFIILGHLVHAIALAPYFLLSGPGPWPAWIALAVVVGIGVASRMVSRTLPDWLYVLLLLALVAPVGLDLAASAGLLHHGVTPTAAAAAGAVLMPVAAVRGTRIPLAAAGAIAVAIAIQVLMQVDTARTGAVAGVAVAASAVMPVLLVALAIDGFRRLVGRELDLSLVQSTVATSRSAVGMRASEELAQLDFDAETLLDDVGSGRIAIPLPGEAAERAGTLAARIRVRLIEGRTDTWLRHAVTESEYLNGRITVDDPNGCAALLAQSQRDGLLLGLWLLTADHPKKSAQPMSAVVRCRETADHGEVEPDGFAMSIEVTGVPRRRIDPSALDAIGSVGVHEVVPGTDGFRVDIDCRVDPHSPAGSTSARAAARSRGS